MANGESKYLQFLIPALLAVAAFGGLQAQVSSNSDELDRRFEPVYAVPVIQNDIEVIKRDVAAIKEDAHERYREFGRLQEERYRRVEKSLVEFKQEQRKQTDRIIEKLDNL